jgi:hypothetical protein
MLGGGHRIFSRITTGCYRLCLQGCRKIKKNSMGIFVQEKLIPDFLNNECNILKI